MNPLSRLRSVDKWALQEAPFRTPPTIPDHTLIQLIGRGSYGEVWRARNVMGTARAVKVVYRHAFDDERPYEREFMGIQRFEPVSRSHDGVVDILQVGRNDSVGYFYYVMELADASDQPDSAEEGVSGAYFPKTLAHEISRRGLLPVDECIELALALSSALAHLHKHGLIHRDIKPSNIIFVAGVPKLADIGLVSEADRSDSYVGTEGYIPPEGPGTRQADIYSLGKVVYEASTGRDRADFPAIPVELTRNEAGKRFLELNAICIKACANDGFQRYASAEELQADLALLQIGKSVRRLHAMERRLKAMTRFGAIAAVLAALALAAFGFARRQARLDRQNLLRIERAEKEARTQLRQALFSQAQAVRRTGQTGQRFDSLAALSKAAAVNSPEKTPPLALRNEAIAALTLADLRLVQPGFLKLGATNVAVDVTFQRYARANPNGIVEVHQTGDDRLLAELNGLTNAVTFVHDFSPNGDFLPIHYQDGLTRVWSLARREIVLTFQPEHELHSLDFSPDSRKLVIVDSARSVKLYELPSGTLLRSESSPAQWLRAHFSPDARQLGLCSQGLTTARVVDVTSGQLLAELRHPRGVRALAWSRDAQWLATGCEDSKVYLWCLPGTEPARVLSGHQSSVIEVDFHPTEPLLASASWDGTIRLWDTASGEPLVSLPATGDLLRFSRDGRHLTFYWDAGHPLWIAEVADQRICRLLRKQGPIQRDSTAPNEGQYCVAFSPDDRWLASGHFDGLRLWDANTGSEVAHMGAGWVRSVFFDPSGREVFAAGDEGVLSWPVEAALAEGGANVPARRSLPGGNPYLRACISVSDGEVACVAHEAVRLLNSNRLLEAMPGLNFVAMSPDGRWLAASTWLKNGGRLWQLPSGRPVRDFAPRQTVGIGFSPDSRWLITGEGDAYCFWDVQTGEPGRRIPRKDSAGGFGFFTFSPDGNTFACAFSRTLVQLFDARTFEELARLDAPPLPMISALAFNNSGTQLAVGTATPFIKLWDLNLMRKQLTAMRLDWSQATLPAPRPTKELPRRSTESSTSGSATATLRETRGSPLDLSPFYNATLDKFWNDENNLAALRKGVQRLAGVDYDVRGAIKLRGQHNQDLLREVRSIPVERRCQRLHFLHSTAWHESDGTTIGSYIIHFADGQQTEIPIVYGRDVRNWWLTREQHAAGIPAAVWIGSTPGAARSGFDIHLFHSVWENPRPNVEILDFDFVSADTQCPPFLIAVTAE
jgi:WD40 repeat protein